MWKGQYRVVTVFPYGAIKLKNKEGLKFKFKGQILKHYLGKKEDSKLISEVDLV